MIAAGSHWLNPYVGVKIPRAASSLKSNSSTTLGLVFHHQRGPLSRLRAQFELGFQDNSTDATQKTQVDLKSNVSFAYRNFVFGVYELLNLSSLSSRDVKLSAAGVYGDSKGFVQLDLNNVWRPTFLSVGLGFSPLKKLGLFALATHSLVPAEPAKRPSLSFGLDYAHSKSFGTKFACDLKGKLSTNFNYSVNKYLSGSLLFDVIYRLHRLTLARLRRETLLGEQSLS